MTQLQTYTTVIDMLQGALPQHNYFHVKHNRSHGSASDYGTLCVHHNRLCSVVQEYITRYGSVSAVASMYVLEEYKLLKEVLSDYSDTLKEDKQAIWSEYLCLIDNAEAHHHDLELEV